MRRINFSEAARIVRSQGLGELGYDDANSFPGGARGNNGSPYSEDVVFNGTVPGSTSDIKQFAAAAIAQQANLPPAPAKETFVNGIVSALFPFDLNASGSQIVNTNPQRTSLLIQNQSTTVNLFFNLGNAASVAAGILIAPLGGVIFDVKCPSDSIFVFSAGIVHGVVLQSTQAVLQGL